MYLIHTDFYVSSMEKSLEFYVTHLGFLIVRDTVIEGALPRYISNNAFDAMRLVLLSSAPGSAGVELVQFQGAALSRAFHVIPHQGSVSFIVESLRDLIERLRGAGIESENGIVTVAIPRVGRSEIAFFRDPDGHSIEFVQVSPS